MSDTPRLTTQRLVLRPFTQDDAPAVQRLASAKEIADGTLSIPHPYPDGAAAAWIAGHAESDALQWAIVRRSDDELLGTIALRPEREHLRAEVGYWIGVSYWNQGYATDAVRAVLRHGLEGLALNRIYAHHFTRNPASGRVMQRAGMRHEGTLREHTLKDGEFLDSAVYAMLRDDLR
ncbi:MAG: GNAT family N-acetyltransferase [Actinomycetota bacterium]|nr:GNAT family N-acetyltransferase [Actinomycetota bacterium]